ncbi:hypothetical protein SAMN05660297_02750 [Natronincola peptidivorans]|uniref:Phage gp6-like head-tail connector protein n=1 Tax=Natronincola peptidivorans TaxID=426128 RepID=A0A1I0FEJ8_9FIRM|nr:head-tail connector protein [Natronincola peptidivorans]SET55622.1 hypothetical protein SAMN05660297_02750 [Natronincola peptidivorans]
MIQEIKDYLRIDDDADMGLEGIIQRGKKYLSRLTGTTLNFEEEDLPQQLLFDYCRYTINNSLEYFETNFATDILMLQLQEGVKACENESEA